MDIPQICNVYGEGKTELDAKLCIICQEKSAQKHIVGKPKVTSFKTLIDKLQERVDEYKERTYVKTWESIKKLSPENLSLSNYIYHRECYSDVTNASHINRLKRTCCKVTKVDNDDNETKPKRATRSSLGGYDKERCFFCQVDTNAPLINLRTFNRSKMMKEAIDVLNNDVLRVRFNSAFDAHAADVKYHLICMVTNVDKVLFSAEEKGRKEIDSDMLIRYSAEEELINSVEMGIKNGAVYEMKDICDSYKNTIHERGGKDHRSEKTLKKYLKSRLLQEVEGIRFETSIQRNVSEKVYSIFASDTILDMAISKILDNKKDNFKTISKAAKIIQAACLKHIISQNHYITESDKNYDSYAANTSVPVELSSMMRWILAGPVYISSKRQSFVEENAISLSHTILFSVKTDRQISYKSANTEKATFRSRYENPHVIGMGLSVRQFGRKKELINMLHKFGYCISNRRCISVETSLANEVIRNSNENGYYLPRNTKKSNLIMFHLDNTDFLEDTIDGRDTTHALLLVGSQYPMNQELLQTMRPVEKSSCTKLLPNSFGDLKDCIKPPDRDFQSSLSWEKFSPVSQTIPFAEACHRYTMPWLVLKSLQCVILEYKNLIKNLPVCILEDDQICIELDISNDINSSEEEVKCTGDKAESNTNLPNMLDSNIVLDQLKKTVCKDIAVEDMPITILSNRQRVDSLVMKELNAEPISEKISICDELHTRLTNKCFTTAELTLLECSANSLKEVLLPSYSAYYSMVYEQDQPYKISNILMFPLVPGPANSYSAIYTAFKLAQNVTTHVLEDSSKTIISLDLDLYERALRLRNSSPELIDKYILRLGELHILFAHIRAVGRYIENTGIDDAWLQSELIGPNTIRQVLTCSHVKRSVIIHEVTLLSIFELYFSSLLKRFLSTFLEKEDSLINIVTEISQAISNKNKIQELHGKLVEILESMKFRESIDRFDKEHQDNPQFKMLNIYMNMIQRMFIFIHASRSKNWSLHLHATENLIPDLRSMDRIKYSRMLPVYLAEMRSLESSDPSVWSAFCKGEFSVQKTPVPFTSIGMDHAGEQVNKVIKIDGGLVGVSRNENARTRYFLTAPLISEIASNFRDKDMNAKHHQNNKAYSKRQNLMKEKLITVLRKCNVNFDDTKAEMHNFVTKQVFPVEIEKDVLSIESVGKEQYQLFVKERMSPDSKVSIWAPVKKLKLKFCSSTNKTRKTKIDDKIVELKGQRLLFSRCAIIASSNRDLDMKSVVGDFELDVIPRSLIGSDGMLHGGSENKSNLITRMTNGYSATSCTPEPTDIHHRMIVIDAMVVVQKIIAHDKKSQKTQKIVTFKDFGDKFLERIEFMVNSFDEVRIVFDFYEELSLKNVTRGKRGNYSAERFILDDDTCVRSSLPTLINNIQTKQDITVYLANKCQKMLQERKIDHLVSANHETKGNILCTEKVNNHEEADTLIIWHCIHYTTTAENKESSSITVFSPDTDVACLLVAFKKQMITNVYLNNGKHILCINSVYESIGQLKADALLSLHALSGCDTTGKFVGKGKNLWWKVIQLCSEKHLRALAAIQTNDPLKEIGLLEEIICMLYNSKSKCLRDARWELFKKCSYESERLPPTTGSFKQAVLRAHCQARTWSLSNRSMQCRPNPLSCGWEISEGTYYVPITSNEPIAPVSVLQLVRCGCNGACLTSRCKCSKGKLVCTDLCNCSNVCENTDVGRFISEENIDEEDMFDEMLL